LHVLCFSSIDVAANVPIGGWVAGMRPLKLLIVTLWLLFPALAPLHAATLERLSLEEMIQKSTEIVRGRMVSSRAALRGPVVYTFVQVQVLDRWKGPAADRVEVAIPGGAYGRLQQSFSGAPNLEPGVDYLLFLWTGRNGVTQLMGLSQGLFQIRSGADGVLLVERAASGELMLDGRTGLPVQDAPISMPLNELRNQVRRLLMGHR
jgi:hypothetical protein